MTPQVKTSKVDQFSHPVSRQKRTWTAIYRKESDTLDFTEFNHDGMAIPLKNTHAQQCTTFH